MQTHFKWIIEPPVSSPDRQPTFDGVWTQNLHSRPIKDPKPDRNGLFQRNTYIRVHRGYVRVTRRLGLCCVCPSVSSVYWGYARAHARQKPRPGRSWNEVQSLLLLRSGVHSLSLLRPICALPRFATHGFTLHAWCMPQVHPVVQWENSLHGYHVRFLGWLSEAGLWPCLPSTVINSATQGLCSSAVVQRWFRFVWLWCQVNNDCEYVIIAKCSHDRSCKCSSRFLIGDDVPSDSMQICENCNKEGDRYDVWICQTIY